MLDGPFGWPVLKLGAEEQAEIVIQPGKFRIARAQAGLRDFNRTADVPLRLDGPARLAKQGSQVVVSLEKRRWFRLDSLRGRDDLPVQPLCLGVVSTEGVRDSETMQGKQPAGI